MTQYFAVIDNQEFEGRSKFDTDYVFYGTAKQCAAVVADVDGRDGNKGVTVYKVKARPDFTNEEDLGVAKDVKGVFETAKGKVEGLSEKWNVPKDKDAARARFEEVKKQAIQEGGQLGAQVGAMIAFAVQQGQRDPKQLAKMAQTGAQAKINELKGRFGDLVGQVRQDAQSVEAEIASDTVKTVQAITDKVVGPDPDALKTVEGTRFVRAAWLVSGNNANRVSVQDLAKAAAPRQRKQAAPKNTK